MDQEKILPLKEYEVFLILRRRNGMTQQELADKLGVTRYWLSKMEAGTVNCDRLREFWNER